MIPFTAHALPWDTTLSMATSVAGPNFRMAESTQTGLATRWGKAGRRSGRYARVRLREIRCFRYILGYIYKKIAYLQHFLEPAEGFEPPTC